MPLLALLLLVAAQQPTIRTTVRAVVALTTVTDRDGRYVDGLGENDFLLYDSGRLQRIAVDVTYVPISLAIAVETSSLAAPALEKVRKIGSLIEPLVIGQRGEAALIAFDNEVRLVQPFTPDSEKLKGALKRLKCGGEGSRLIDGVWEAIRLLAARPPNRRRVLLLISENKDRSSKTKLEQALTLAQRENVMVYPLTYSAFATALLTKPGPLPAPGNYSGLNLIGIFREIAHLAETDAAEAFARYTGASRLSFLKQRALERAVSRIGEELHAQYLVSFQVPAEATPRFHPIEVRVKDRPDLLVRTRPGYWLAEPE